MMDTNKLGEAKYISFLLIISLLLISCSIIGTVDRLVAMGTIYFDRPINKSEYSEIVNVATNFGFRECEDDYETKEIDKRFKLIDEAGYQATLTYKLEISYQGRYKIRYKITTEPTLITEKKWRSWNSLREDFHAALGEKIRKIAEKQ